MDPDSPCRPSASHQDFLRLEKDVETLRQRVSSLERELSAVRANEALNRHPVELHLRQKGFAVLHHGENAGVLVPPHASPAQSARFYQLLRRYSFRLFARDLLAHPRVRDPGEVARYCSSKTARGYLEKLVELGVVEAAEGGYRLIPEGLSFGPTLEWYVREIFQRELLAPALFNVRLGGTRHGGDYDVVGLVAGHLIYVEVKSSPPRGVELCAVSAFLNRLRDLQPHMAVFLVDTELRMKDKIVPLFAEALAQDGRREEEWPVERLVNETFHIGTRIYLTNSRKGIYSNLRLCLRDCFRKRHRCRAFFQ